MYIDHVGINTNDMEAAIPILSRMCADCCSGLSAAHSSAYAAGIPRNRRIESLTDAPERHAWQQPKRTAKWPHPPQPYASR